MFILLCFPYIERHISHEKKKLYWEQLELRRQSFVRSHPSFLYCGCHDEYGFPAAEPYGWCSCSNNASRYCRRPFTPLWTSYPSVLHWFALSRDERFQDEYKICNKMAILHWIYRWQWDCYSHKYCQIQDREYTSNRNMYLTAISIRMKIVPIRLEIDVSAQKR